VRVHLCMAVLLLGALVAGCGNDADKAKKHTRTGPPVVQCVNYPLFFFAGQLAGDAVEVRFDAPAGEDPAFWKPTDDQITAFQSADLIVRNGAAYAKWMKTVSLPASRMVDTSAAFAVELITTTGGVTHAHGPGGAHDHGDLAFTTWLDFGQAAAQADAIGAALGKRDLVPHERVRESAALLRAHLLALHESMKSVGTRWGKRPLLASHSVYQYLARAYGLSIKSEHFEPGEVPSEEALAILGSMLKNYKATWMLWEAAPLPETVRKLEALGVRSVVFDPCANKPASGDFFSVMQANVARLQKALAK